MQEAPELPVTMVIIAACGALFVWDITQGADLASGNGSTVACDYSLYAPSIARDGEWYRVVTSAFSHANALHIGFNMWLLLIAGRSLETAYGPLTFAALFFTGVLGGSLGALALHPGSLTVGASGAVFALVGAIAVLQTMAGRNIFKDGIGPLIVFNVIFSFQPGISLGGHLGGLAAGLIAGLLLGLARRGGTKALAVVPTAIAGVGLGLLVALVPLAGWAANQLSSGALPC